MLLLGGTEAVDGLLDLVARLVGVKTELTGRYSSLDELLALGNTARTRLSKPSELLLKVHPGYQMLKFFIVERPCAAGLDLCLQNVSPGSIRRNRPG